MTKFVLLLGFILFLSGLAYAAAPTVDFNYFPASPVVFQPITFDPNITASPDLNIMFWQFDSDGNVNYYTTTDQNVIFQDDFTSLGNWTTQAGSPSLSGGGVTGTGSTRITTPVNFTSTPVSFTTTINFSGATERLFYGIKDGVGSIGASGNGYFMEFNNNTNQIILYSVTTGSATDFITTGFAFTTATDYNVSARRGATNDWNVYVNNVLIAGPVINSDFSSFSFAALEWDAGGGIFDNVLITTDGGTFNPINKDLNQSHTFLSAGNKTVCLSAGNTDGNTLKCKTFNVSGTGVFQVFDENTNLAIPFPTATVNGQTFTGDVTGVINVGSAVTTGDYLIMVEADGYPPRPFTFFLDINTSFAEALYLIDSNKARSIEFLIRDENNTKYPNNFFRIEKNNKIVAQVYLDDKAKSIPIPVANITTDYNFFVDINSTGANLFDYGDTDQTISVPINENTLLSVTPFGITVSDLTSIDQNNNTSSYTFKIYPNTYHPYRITIDANSLNYFPRYYHVRSLGNVTAQTLQPYLLDETSNAVPATMSITDSLSGQALVYYLVKFYADVGDQANVLVESPQTDSAGQFIFTTITGKNYFIEIYDPSGDLIKSGDFISSTSNTYFIDIFSGIISGTGPQTGIVDVNMLSPTNNFLFLNDLNNFGVSFDVLTTGPSVYSVKVDINNGTTNLKSQTFTPSFPATTYSSGSQFDVNFTTSQDNLNITILITINTSGGVILKTYHYPLKQQGNPSINFPGLGQLCSSVGNFGCTLIWLFIGLMISLGLRFSPVFGVDNNGMFGVMVVWTGLGAFIGLVPYVIAFLAILGGIGYWGIRNRPLG